MLLPPPSDMVSLTNAECSHVLGILFERSTTLESLLQADLGSTRFHSYDALISMLAERLSALLDGNSAQGSVLQLDSILCCHPRLGSTDPTAISAASRAEQAQLQSATSEAAKAQAKELTCLNERYESRFQGLVYLVFVNGRPRSEIMVDMRVRIEQNDINAERRAGIRALCDIARDRLQKAKIARTLDEWRQRDREG